MKRFIDNAITLSIGIIMLIAMIVVMCGCDNKYPDNLTKGYEVYVFMADWCEYCKKDAPRINDLKKITTVFIFDVDEYRDLVDKFDIHRVPTYLVMGANHDPELRTDDIETVFAHVLGCM